MTGREHGGELLFGAQRLPWHAGESVAVALLNAGVRASRHSTTGQPRQAFCGMGVCHECRVLVNGQQVLACQTPCEPDQHVMPCPGPEARP